MFKWKKTLIILLLIVVVGALIYYLPKLKKTGTNQNQTTQKVPVSSYSLNGTVTSINGMKLELLLADQKTSKDAVATSATLIQKEVSSKTGISFVAAKFSDIKAGSQLIIYSTTDLRGGQDARLTKIIILK